MDIGLQQLQDQSFRLDMALSKGDLVEDGGLRTACYLSLFTDRRASPDELPPEDASVRGWWGDLYPNQDGDEIGSKLWLLKREKRTVETLNRAEDYSREALQWMIDDGVATEVSVDAEWNAEGFLILTILISEPTGSAQKNFKFTAPWSVEGARGNS